MIRIRLWPLIQDESQPAAVRVGSPQLLIEKELTKGLPLPGALVWAFSPDGRTLALSGDGMVRDGTVRLLETATGEERSRFVGHGGDVTALSFSPDGCRLASGSQDTTILVWDVTDRLQGGCLRPAQLSAKEKEKLWADLAADDAGRAGRAIWTLAADPSQAVPYLAERLRSSAADAKVRMAKVPQLLRDLNDEAFTVREKARAELVQLGAAAESALRQALKESPSPETRRSLEQLLKALEAKHQTPSGEVKRHVPSRESLRGVRALEVLEQIGTREAREVLKALATSAGTEFSLAQEARVALDRLERADRR